MAAAAAARPPLLPPPLWARCHEKAEEAQEQERFCWERVRQWSAFRSRRWQDYGWQSELEVVIASWRQAAQEWRRLAGIWAAAMASYHCVRAAGSQRAITEPVRLGAEWACGAPTGASVAFQLDRAVHYTGRAWGAEPDAWRECQWQWHAVENRGELPPAPAAREPWRDFENLSVVLGQLHGSSAPRLDGTVGQLFTST